MTAYPTETSKEPKARTHTDYSHWNQFSTHNTQPAYGSSGDTGSYKSSGYSDYTDYDYGGYVSSGYSGCDSHHSSGLDDRDLALYLIVGGAIVTFILYRAINTSLGGGRQGGDTASVFSNSLHRVMSGLEEFEEKIERLTDNAGDEDAENSWISGLFNQFSSLYGQDTLTMEDIDGMEPPILDETWDLGVKKRNSGAKKSSVEKENILEKEAEEDIEEANIRAKRSTKEKVSGGRTKCRKEMWRCVSRVVEDSLDYMDKPDGLMGLAQKSMFKIAFHGSMSNAWTGVMSIPEARRVKKCMNAHEKCLGYEAVWAEAKVDKADTNDQAEETDKRRRLIVNPEFVQSLDTSVGVKQYEEEAED